MYNVWCFIIKTCADVVENKQTCGQSSLLKNSQILQLFIAKKLYSVYTSWYKYTFSMSW